jgi:Transposase DDE domain group 1
MTTECSQNLFPFHSLNQREVRGNFDGGAITSDGGGLLLREVEQQTKIIQQFAACFTDFRDPELVEHRVPELVAQRIYGLALGYEDLNDHDELRRDPLLAVLVEKQDPSGEDRRRARDQGAALAGKSTLNRLELGAGQLGEKERYKKIIRDEAAVDRTLVDIFLQAHREPPQEIILDLDSTDIPLHGEQEERFFHGYYGHYCYLPLYIVCGQQVLCARLRPSNIDGAKGSVAERERLVAQIRQAWPQVRIILRADSGFCRDELLSWCEQHGVDYVMGVAQNARLLAEIAAASAQAAAQFQQTGKAARVFTEFVYRTQDSWSRARRVIAKAEHLEKGPNPRFVVTSLSLQETVFPAPSRWAPQSLYEEFYCARGDMENRIKEQMMLFADRTSTSWMRSNQIRLYFSTVAYLLMHALRRLGLVGTELAQAQCNTVRLKLLKIGGLVRITVRKIWISLSAGYPHAQLFRQVQWQLQQAAPLRC